MNFTVARFFTASISLVCAAGLSACGGDSTGTQSPSSAPQTAVVAASSSLTTSTAMVLRVHDGDTLTITDPAHGERNIRFNGIDAPETDQPFGSASAQHLSSLVMGKTVGVVGDKIDLYGRTVAVITLNGQDINFLQVQQGMAWHYKAYASEQTVQNAALYATAETQARAAKIGLWASTNPIAPWDWRNGVTTTPGAVPSTPATPVTTPTCYTGPEGGTYTLTASGNKNYGGC